jgi:hypothetical protein
MLVAFAEAARVLGREGYREVAERKVDLDHVGTTIHKIGDACAGTQGRWRGADAIIRCAVRS